MARTTRQRVVRWTIIVGVAFIMGAVISGSASMYLITSPQHAPLRTTLRAYQEELERAGASSVEEVQLQLDGTRLVGTLARPGSTGPHEVVLVAHGLGDDRTGLSGVAALLVRAQYVVLSVDERAHGESTGDVVTFGVREHADLTSWVEWLRENEHVGCVHGYGLSLGASSLLLAAAEGAPLCSVWSDSAYASFEDVAMDQSGAFLGLGPWFGHTVGRPSTLIGFLLARVVRGVDLWAAAPVKAVGTIRIPTMLVHGDRDRLVRPAQWERLRAAAPRAESWLVPAAAHVQAREVAGHTYDERLLGWLAAASKR